MLVKLLQDICTTCFQLPQPYHLAEVQPQRGRRIAAGGEATVYEGTVYDDSLRGRAVVVREFHAPNGGDWDSHAGQCIHKVRGVRFDVLGVCTYSLPPLTTVDR